METSYERKVRTLRVPKEDWERVEEFFKRLGYERVQELSIPYPFHWAYRKGDVLAVLFTSGILRLEGGDEWVVNKLRWKVLDEVTPFKGVEVGCAMSGFSDLFGPIVVCCAVITPENYKRVLSLAPKVGREIEDEILLKKVEILEDVVDGRCKVLEPKALNILRNLGKMGLNRILDEAYTDLVWGIRRDYPNARIYVKNYSDTSAQRDFGPLARVISSSEAENYVSIFCASMLARAKVLKWLKERNLPKGNKENAVELARRIYRENPEKAEELIKHFWQVKSP